MDYRLSHLSPEKGESYESSFHKKNSRKYVWKWEQEVLLDILNKYFDKEPENYLDFACGTGRVIEHVASKVSNATGIDVSESMLQVARNKEALKKATLINLDITKEDNAQSLKYDLITAFRFFLNAQTNLKQEVIQKLSRILADGGIIVFNIHLNKSSILANIIKLYQFSKGTSRSNMVSYAEVEKLVNSAGLKIIKTYHYGVIPIIRESPGLPYEFFDRIERVFSKTSFSRPFSQNIIYVCSKKGHL